MRGTIKIIVGSDARLNAWCKLSAASIGELSDADKHRSSAVSRPTALLPSMSRDLTYAGAVGALVVMPVPSGYHRGSH
jgi:hypothetical protein